MLEIRVHKIRSVCPVHKVSDLIVIDEPEILLDKARRPLHSHPSNYIALCYGP